MNSFSKTILALVMIVSVGFLVFYTYEPKVAEAGWYTTGGTWSYRKVITINNSKVEGTSDLASFPILVDLTDADLASYAQADGDDILFTSSDGTTKLDHEIELYTTATGRLTAWVRIPTLDFDNDTIVYMYYGNGAASSQQNATGVWDSNYKGVWHLSEAPSNNNQDSTSNNNDGSPQGMESGDQVTGQIDGSLTFDGSDTEYVNITDHNSLDISSSLSVCAWINPSALPGASAYDGIFNKGGSGEAAGLNHNWYFVAAKDVFVTGDGVAWGFENNAGSNFQATDNNFTMTLGTFYYYCGVFDDSANTVTLYRNGSQVGQTTGVTDVPITGTQPAVIGAFSDVHNAENHFNGTIDEVRLSSTARSADWIKTEYNNQSATSTFYSISSAQSSEPEDIKIRGGGSATNSNVKIRGGLGWYSQSWLYRKPITINKSKVANSDLTDFPVLVDLTDSNLASSAQADGDDILFTSGDGTTKLSHEIELYTNSTGRLTAWVKVPTLYAERDTTIYMYYGNSGASSQQNITGVWDSNYTFVTHLAEASGTPLDSTSNNNDMSSIGGSPDYQQAGKIGYGINFDGATEYIRTAAGTLTNAPTASGAYTMSVWWNADVEDDDNVLMFYGAGADNQSNGLRTKTSADGYYNYWFSNDLEANVALSTGDWFKLDATYNGTTRSIYHNGVLVNSDTPAARNSPNSGFYIASNIFANYWDGKLDDPRMSKIARSADWILTEYNNQSATSTFYTAGSEETNGNATTRGGVKFR